MDLSLTAFRDICINIVVKINDMLMMTLHFELWYANAFSCFIFHFQDKQLVTQWQANISITGYN